MLFFVYEMRSTRKYSVEQHDHEVTESVATANSAILIHQFTIYGFVDTLHRWIVTMRCSCEVKQRKGAVFFPLKRIKQAAHHVLSHS